MGVFDKIKNLFYEEEIVEVPKENLKEEIKQAEKVEQKKDEMEDVISERDLVKSETNFKFPVIFEEEDFIEVKKETRIEPKKESYTRTTTTEYTKYKKPTLDREVIREVIEKPKKFTPSPVISPVYGVLDKNYKKDEITDGKHSLEKTKELVINFDTIRQKAYGSLSDDIERELDSKTNKIDEIEKEIDNILEENNLLADLEEDSVEVTKVEVENDDEYNYEDFGVEYKMSEEVSTPTKSKKKKEKKETTKDILIDTEEDTIDEKTQEEVNQDNEKEIELTEDLFNLIDSMYDR
ncbi:MAG: hypothetical protein IJO32_02730 [Bacilli bacterium]|nr:hypothetical protein [Bacilli bacterium]